MIICKTPYRISFFGGGTDFPDWYNKYGGRVISTSINKYSYIVIRNLPEIFKYKFRIRYYFREETNSKNGIKHPVVRELLKLNKSIKNIDISKIKKDLNWRPKVTVQEGLKKTIDWYKNCYQ